VKPSHLPTYAELVSAQMSVREWSESVFGKQTFQGNELMLEVWLHADVRMYWWNGSNRPGHVPKVLFAGSREFFRLVWEEDADAWYEAEAARMAERAPA
jgi:hypothetical protein